MSGRETPSGISAGKTMVFPLLLLFLSGGWILWVGCVDEESVGIERGMSESDVKSLLGSPTFIIDEEGEFSTYLEKDCDTDRVRQILVYDRPLWPDVAVALNDEQKVECVNVAVFMRFG